MNPKKWNIGVGLKLKGVVITWATIWELNICYCQLAIITDFIFNQKNAFKDTHVMTNAKMRDKR